MLRIVPSSLLLDHFIISLAPKFAKLVELLDLRVLHLDKTVLTVANLVTLLDILLRAIAAAATRTIVTVVSSRQQSVELTIAQLAIGLVLNGSLTTVAKLYSGDYCGVERVDLWPVLLLLFFF